MDPDHFAAFPVSQLLPSGPHAIAYKQPDFTNQAPTDAIHTGPTAVSAAITARYGVPMGSAGKAPLVARADRRVLGP